MSNLIDDELALRNMDNPVFKMELDELNQNGRVEQSLITKKAIENLNKVDAGENDA